ncbi:M20/M25/M40 family metallo-hydrolase [Hellea balneolensis]|uniref:M20/M25/M40 family metallo-hydrolase n=1 Tax=Hellea balneolensis TaxID=287478 RepID=UPI0004147C0B|nr:M20/M25/M40 family metallo-hydrolase [Hellea balneolensis]
MLRKWGLLLSSILLALIFASMAIIPPAPQSGTIAADRFSSARAMTDLRIIAAKPHPTGSDENAKVREYLSMRLDSLGLKVNLGEGELGERALKRLNKWSGENKSEQAIFNVIGILPGTDVSKPAVLLMAHHDTVWDSPGAADDTVGIVSILEIVRALKESGPHERGLIVLFTDGEEVGLSGARHFFSSNPLRDKVGAVINFEARGGGGTANLFQTSKQNGAAMRVFAKAVKQPSASSLSTFVYNVLPNDTDLTPALEGDYTAYNIANIGGAEYYHSPKIEVEALDERTLQHMGSQGLDLTRALLAADTLPDKKPDATFFDVFGLATIIYAPFWGWIFLGLAGLCYGLSLKGEIRTKEILSGAVKMLIFFGLGGGLLYGLNVMSGSGAGANYYDRLAAIRKLEGLAVFFCAAAFFAVFGPKALTVNARLGAALPLFLLGIVGQAFAPTATYFISLPLMLCGFKSLMMQRWPSHIGTKLAVVILTAGVAGYMIALGHLLMLGIGPDLLSVSILPAALAALVILPLYEGVKKKTAYFLAMTALLVSAAIALWVRLDPIAATIPLY